MTQNISVVYVSDQGTEPCMNDILLALVDALGIEIVHADRYGNSVRVKMQGDTDINVIRHVLHKAFPHKLSIFDGKPEPHTVCISYLTGTSSRPSAVAIAAEIVNKLGVCVEIDVVTAGKAVVLSVPAGTNTNKIRNVLDKAFPFALRVVADKPKPDTIAAAEDILREAARLMKAKNADYGDSWRLMRLSSITDQILVKINRVITIEESTDAPKVSEGVESEYRDILNYCVFAIIKLREENARSE